MKYPFTNLVIQGGGIKALAYIGALDELEKVEVLSQIKGVVGTSVGSIIALLLSLRYSVSEIKAILKETKFNHFEDDWDPFRIVTEYGLYDGQTLLDWLKTHISNKGLSPDVTFQTLRTKGYKDLHVFATDLNLRKVKVFSATTSPETSVAEAVRAALSIPLFFKAWRFTNSIPDDHIYVDGGVAVNYPLTFFDQMGHTPDSTLGLCIDQLQEENETNHALEYNEIYNYISALFNTLLDAQMNKFNADPKIQKRSICIQHLGFSATNFKVSSGQQEELIAAGANATRLFLKDFPIKAKESN